MDKKMTQSSRPRRPEGWVRSRKARRERTRRGLRMPRVRVRTTNWGERLRGTSWQRVAVALRAVRRGMGGQEVEKQEVREGRWCGSGEQRQSMRRGSREEVEEVEVGEKEQGKRVRYGIMQSSWEERECVSCGSVCLSS